MHTASTRRAETRTISVNAPPGAVLELVGDPCNLPRWAPNFARAGSPRRRRWIIATGGGEARITVRVSGEHGTVDLLAAANPDRGSFSRVVPNDRGSEYLFTLFFPDDTDEDALARQMAVVEQEGGAGALRGLKVKPCICFE